MLIRTTIHREAGKVLATMRDEDGKLIQQLGGSSSKTCISKARHQAKLYGADRHEINDVIPPKAFDSLIIKAYRNNASN